MPYVDRDQAGNITGLYALAQREGHEFVEGATIYVDPKTELQAQIDTLERSQLLPRIARDVFIIQMEEKAIALGAAQVPALDAATSLAIAYATNLGYQRLKDFDAQITVLRNQMEAIV